MLPFLFFLLLLGGVSAEVYHTNDTIQEGGKEILIERIGEGQARISVSGDPVLLKNGESKEVQGVLLTVHSTFFVDELEDRTVDLSYKLTDYCGDGDCKSGESKATCCQDCGCSAGFECKSSGCALIVPDECKEDSDCDDKDEYTEDSCGSKRPRKCIHLSLIQCEQAEDCEDDNPCTTDTCEKKECFNRKIPDCGGQVESPERPLEQATTSPATGQAGPQEETLPVGVWGRLFLWLLSFF